MLKSILTPMSLAPLLLSNAKNIWMFLPPSLFLASFASLPLLHSPLTSSKFYANFLLDPLSSSLIILSLWISGLMILASTKILLQSASPTPFSLWVILLTILMATTFSANNMLTFYILFESTLIPTTALILGWGYQPERLQASFYFMIYTVFASLPLLISILLMMTYQGHVSLILPWQTPPMPKFLFTPWWFMMNAAFLVKLPMFLTHLWLPKAHVEAPVAGSMVLAAILLKLGGYGLIRTMLICPPPSSLPKSITLSISLWGAVITSTICLRQSDLKALIAYSSVGHMGLLIAGTMTNSFLGVSGAITMMIAHGLTSSALFFLANTTYEATNTRSIILIKGLLTSAPSMAPWWFIFTAANMAAPPSLNLFSEILLITSILSWNTLTLPLLTTTGFLTAAYSLLMYTSIHHGPTPPFMNPTTPPSPNNLSTLLLHALPLLLLILKPEIFTI